MHLRSFTMFISIIKTVAYTVGYIEGRYFTK